MVLIDGSNPGDSFPLEMGIQVFPLDGWLCPLDLCPLTSLLILPGHSSQPLWMLTFSCLEKRAGVQGCVSSLPVSANIENLPRWA